MVTVKEIRNAQHSRGPATILAFVTTTPYNCVLQADYPDYYFRITQSEHMTDLKEKFKRMCTLVVEVPKLGEEVTIKGIKDGVSPSPRLPTSSSVPLLRWTCLDPITSLPSFWPQTFRQAPHDVLVGLLHRGTVLRLAKDLTENNKGARVLFVYCEITAVTFRRPSYTHLDSLVGQALFDNDAASMIIGVNPNTSVKCPIFKIELVAHTILSDSDGAAKGRLREVGFMFHLMKDVPRIISNNIEKSLVEAFTPIGINDWNSIFWIAQPGGPAILDQAEAKLGLKEEKLAAMRHILSEYRNMSSVRVTFILDEVRKRSVKEGKATTGEGLEWALLFGFGLGLTAETVVLHSVPV